ncbi:MAG: ATP/GTP-binding protein [Candidatus Bathyarchaeota archaeon]|nr:ATP/GTP-binding protein [Candidatus Bathyarchaeota archaeon]
MFLIFVLGTAGSGKSELTGVFTRWLQLQGEDALAVNLDPGAIILPYSANVDVRDYIKIEALMEEYGLGPNGGLILASELMVELVDQLASDIDDFGPDVALIDTPGQMEMFAFRDIGAKIAEGLSDEGKGILYLFDSVLCRDPLNYVMNMFLASAVNSRFVLPQVSVLSKADLLEEELEEIEGWAAEPALLEEAINSRLTGLNRLMSQDMMEVISRLGVEFVPIPFSTKTNLGFNRLYSEISMVFMGGEPFTT